MSLPAEHQVWILREQPTDKIHDDTFVLETRSTPKASELKDGQVIVKASSFSNDPAQRLWMDGSIDPRRLYTAPIKAGDIVRSNVIGTVVVSKSNKWKEGDEVFGNGFWSEYSILDDSGPLTNKLVKLPGQSDYITSSILGLTGQTAYLGAFHEMGLKPEHTLVVSGAAGGVGSALVQIAKKVIGVKRVVGIAGGKDKCEWVKSLGADECIDYKDPKWPTLLADALPDYADRFFDNVGGEIFNVMLTLIKRHGLIVICGAIAGYNDKGMNVTNWGQLIFNRPTIKGMLIFDHNEKLEQAIADLTKWVKDGTITNAEGETVVEGTFAQVPEIYQKLFTGANRGKLITKLV